MEFGLSTPALLFSAISLIMLAFTTRFLSLANLIRELHAKWKERGEGALAAQLRNLRLRIKLIVAMQILGVASFLLCIVSMLLIFLARIVPAEIAFVASLVLLLSSLGLSLVELSISARALDILMEEGGRGRA